MADKLAELQNAMLIFSRNDEEIESPVNLTRRKYWLKRSAAVLLFSLFMSSGIENNQCRRCGVQEYDRYVFGISVDALSEREYDEYGTYRVLREAHPGANCSHNWRVASSTSVMGIVTWLCSPYRKLEVEHYRGPMP
ncbi:MAG: hypothetical protein ACI8W8_000248 [Rhodothermales bacterium]|jgi:hypothetical protein